MSIQLSVAVRNARLDAIETTIGASPTLEIRTGAPPANCAADDSGSLLATLELPADFMAAADAGAKTMSGTWQVEASGAGTAAHFRIKTSGAAVALQGTVGESAADLILDNTDIAEGQTVKITKFTLTDGNA